ncbi:MAG TPA: hypothetical protein VK427_04990 [Kofleriaceae bacterium]|nr:hypothetical protein [Kofleriaceae bacterium]
MQPLLVTSNVPREIASALRADGYEILDAPDERRPAWLVIVAGVHADAAAFVDALRATSPAARSIALLDPEDLVATAMLRSPFDAIYYAPARTQHVVDEVELQRAFVGIAAPVMTATLRCATGEERYVAVTGLQRRALESGQWPCPGCARKCKPRLSDFEIAAHDREVLRWREGRWTAGFVLGST